MCIVGEMVTRVRTEVRDLKFESHIPHIYLVCINGYYRSKIKDPKPVVKMLSKWSAHN